MPLLPHENPARPLRILLVEDHAATRQILARLLQRAGYQVITAEDVTSALARASENTFDVVLSDLGLPDGSGLELMAELRDKYSLRGIALTGYGMEDDLKRTREAGFLNHLVKPVDFTLLQRALQSL